MIAPMRTLLSGRPLILLGIVIGNLIPVGGVLFLGWDAVQILILYWVENLVIGALTLPRILAARGETPAAEGQGKDSPGCLGLFFTFHYGMFCLGHGIFAFILAHDFIKTEGVGAANAWARTFGSPDFWWAALALALVNLVMQVREWWMPKLWRTASPTMEMFRPYGRIAVLHVTVLAGAWLMARYNAPAYAVLFLCLGKMLLELIGAAVTGRLAPKT